MADREQTSVPGRRRLEREKRTVEAMIRLACRDLHAGGETLCPDCEALRAYAMQRLDACKFGADKPKCSACPVHCYKPAMREKIRAVMKYAGPRMMVRHPLLAVGHLVDGVRYKP
jgi:predicted amidophosphoribosyltransferase